MTFVECERKSEFQGHFERAFQFARYGSTRRFARLPDLIGEVAEGRSHAAMRVLPATVEMVTMAGEVA